MPRTLFIIFFAVSLLTLGSASLYAAPDLRTPEMQAEVAGQVKTSGTSVQTSRGVVVTPGEKNASSQKGGRLQTRKTPVVVIEEEPQ